MSREALAVAHASGKIRDVVLAAGQVSELALYTLRWLDNSDRGVYETIVAQYTLKLRRSGGTCSMMTREYARNVTRRVLSHMKDQRCQTCAGTSESPQANGVVMPCANPDCRGGIVPRGTGWTSRHDAAAKIIRTEIGSALAQIRDQIV